MSLSTADAVQSGCQHAGLYEGARCGAGPIWCMAAPSRAAHGLWLSPAAQETFTGARETISAPDTVQSSCQHPKLYKGLTREPIRRALEGRPLRRRALLQHGGALLAAHG